MQEIDWHFEVIFENQLTVDDVIDGVGAPGERVISAAAWPHASAPFVGKQDLGAIVVKGG
mgnify:CR=1 FL=1